MLLAGLYAIVLSGGALAASRPHPRYLAFGARHKRAAKLAVTKVSDPPSSFTGALTVKYTVANLGNSHSGPGQTRLYLSPSRTLRAHQKPIAKHKLAGLGAGQRTSRTVKLTATGMSPGSYFVIACVRGTVSQRNCRASREPGALRSTSAPNPSPGPSPSPTPSPNPPGSCAVTDASCVQNGVFVSPSTGNDLYPGTRALPKATLADAIATAAAVSGENVYATVGTYHETLNVANGVSVYGGYNSSWSAATSGATIITGGVDNSLGGSTEAAVADDITKPTVIRQVTLYPATPAEPGASSYGVRGDDAPGLLLKQVTILAAAGVPGANGLNGANGANGGGGTSGKTGKQGGAGGIGGAGADGYNGGNGGAGWYATAATGANSGGSGAVGAPGLPTTDDACGLEGGAGGAGGNDTPTAGGNGRPGEPGCIGADGTGGGQDNADPASDDAWLSDSGTPGTNGTDGHGGGGGGGGGAHGACVVIGCSDNGGGGAGGGGGGGSGGGAGTGGQGGGGSFGIFLTDSAGAIVQDSMVTSANGATGGAGGIGGVGGAGGSIGFGGSSYNTAGEGGGGGVGGTGGWGGGGGGGAGGPSIAIAGLTAAAVPGTQVTPGVGGTGGAGGPSGGGGGIGTTGAHGISAAYATTGS
jgi:hypothetical protein